ncbi:MAG: hypothetical protein HOO06_14340 [Bdellovibrionaceae bacterium]|nr:hypothetical protein [Pseudobdellovibrionaceae bacterium]
MQKITYILLCMIISSTSLAKGFKESTHPAAQEARDRILRFVNKLLNSELPEGCHLVSMNPYWEIGTGEQYKSHSTLVKLKINGENLEIAIPHINGIDNDSSYIKYETRSKVINQEYHEGLAIHKYQRRTDELYFLKELKNRLITRNYSETNKAITGVKSLSIKWNAKGKVGGLYFQEKFSDRRGGFFKGEPVHACETP